MFIKGWKDNKGDSEEEKMTSNKTWFTILFFVLALSIFSGVSYGIETVSAANVRFTLVRVIPDPVEPGKTFDILMQLDNLYQDQISNVKVAFADKYPFYIDQSDTRIREFASIEKGGSVSFRFKLRVDDSAVQENNSIRFLYQSNKDTGGLYSQDVRVNIQSVSSAVGIASVTVTPQEITPGGYGSVKVAIRNDALSLIKDLSLKLDLSSSAIPFAPSQSTTEKRIRQLLRGESADVVFDVVALPDAEAGVYKVPIILTYSDELGKGYNKTDIIGVVVGGVPELSVQVDKSTIYISKEQGKVILRLVNKGFVNVKFLDVKISQSNDFKLLSNPETYVGKIESDDFETLEIEIAPKKYQNGNLIIPLILDYKDANNKPYHQEINVSVVVLSKKEAGVNGGFGFVGFLIGLVVVVFLVIEFRAFRKKSPHWSVFYFPLYLVKVIFGPILRLFRRKHKK